MNTIPFLNNDYLFDIQFNMKVQLYGLSVFFSGYQIQSDYK